MVFFLLIFVFKKKFLFLRLKNLFGNPNGQKINTVLKLNLRRKLKTGKMLFSISVFKTGKLIILHKSYKSNNANLT